MNPIRRILANLRRRKANPAKPLGRFFVEKWAAYQPQNIQRINHNQ